MVAVRITDPTISADTLLTLLAEILQFLVMLFTIFLVACHHELLGDLCRSFHFVVLVSLETLVAATAFCAHRQLACCAEINDVTFVNALSTFVASLVGSHDFNKILFDIVVW